jgi:hypothetical protein
MKKNIYVREAECGVDWIGSEQGRFTDFCENGEGNKLSSSIIGWKSLN